eukprot:TRINITY_DN1536_c0_g1_i1.p1 TRINITY_DN1536_c0_g1~~TRINITY_DN1536_c0_g1_i1.p1  ORF type:complete len:462 (+),score=100.66 TRINITY_DN1536_c0_g1_i1:38-1387(+)
MALNVGVYLVCIILVVVTCSFSTHGSVPVFVMLPLNAVDSQGIVDPYGLSQNFTQLKNGGVAGVTTDVWWGMVENSGPQQYNWTAYDDLFKLVDQSGLQLQVTMSFHQCGGNVGDDCNIPLPQWVLSLASGNNLFYQDANGNEDQEYLSLGIDNIAALSGRTAVDVYTDFMTSFAKRYSQYLGSLISNVQIGMGPAGELRYPAYNSAYWTFCGIGAFQMYDANMLAMLSAAANQSGVPQYGDGGPDNAGSYNDTPCDTEFFCAGGYNNYESDYGQFFLTWYTQALVDHGDAILAKARSVFGSKAGISGKLSGVHWWYMDPSHAAELTAGYKNDDDGNGYDIFASMFAKHNASLDFTCLEMLDSSQPADCACGPQELVTQVKEAAQDGKIGFAGENALPVFDQASFAQIEYQASNIYAIDYFAYLRLDGALLNSYNWPTFTSFVANMAAI